jgi:hypothetical protein
MLTRIVACLLVGAVVGCGGGDDGRPAAAKRAVPEPTSTQTDTRPDRLIAPNALLGTLSPWTGDGTLLAPLDRRSLEPGVPWADLGEYHGSWSASPDGRMAAFGISAPGEEARIGVRVIDLGTLRTIKDLELGIVAERVGWIAPDRLVAYLQTGELVVIDPLSGEELTRQALGATSCPDSVPSAVTPVGFVMVIAVGGSARLVLTDGTGRARTHELREIAAGRSFGFCQGAGMVVDRSRMIAYVVGARAPVAEIDLRTMRARRHRIASAPRLLTVRGCRACGADLTTAWLGGDRLAVAGIHVRPRGPIRRPLRTAGAVVIDTRTWTARTIARRAGAVARAGDRLLVFDGRHPAAEPRRGFGLRVHDRSGRLRYTVLQGERVGAVEVAGARAYAWTPRGVRVIDLRRGRVIARFPHRRRDVQLLLPR